MIFKRPLRLVSFVYFLHPSCQVHELIHWRGGGWALSLTAGLGQELLSFRGSLLAECLGGGGLFSCLWPLSILGSHW